MNIGISFCGEGLGHASRISAIAKELNKEHNITFWCPNQVKDFFLSNYKEAKIYSVPLLSLSKKDNKIQIIKTINNNFEKIIFNKKIIENLAYNLKELKIDIVISDYEPFLAKAAKKANIPLLLFNHPGVITKYKKLNISFLLSKLTANFMMPNYRNEKLIISSFYNGDVGPIIREDIKKAKIKNEEYILVYLKTSLKDKLLPILGKINTSKFKFFPNEKEDFIENLTACKGVIAPAGHQLISECLYLKKPMLLIPEQVQYEQILNAEMYLKTQMGNVIDNNKLEESIINFISQIDQKKFIRNEVLEDFIFQDDLENAVNKINHFIHENSLKNKNNFTNLVLN